ncbi:hypothetical protein V5799_002925 [Amblyomma americanum]|uniref:Uncharacterized protein n=1 Tax=Amblyomma americanum TaxID=6943 RepID=A0AAQ4DAF5_AMBAM
MRHQKCITQRHNNLATRVLRLGAGATVFTREGRGFVPTGSNLRGARRSSGRGSEVSSFAFDLSKFRTIRKEGAVRLHEAIPLE